MYEYPLKITGVLRFDPQPAFKTKKAQPPWWLLLKCEGDWVEYYQWLLFQETGIKLQKPSWGTHISVIRGEEPLQNKEVWGQLEGLSAGANLAITMRTNASKGYWWMDAQSSSLNDIRLHFGLPSKSNQSFHFTLGRI